MIEFMIFLWIIGWLCALGVYQAACEKISSNQKWYSWIILFISWPHYLGYASQ